MEEHDIVIIGRIGVLADLLHANPAQRLVLRDAQILYFLLMNLTQRLVTVHELKLRIIDLSCLG